MTFPQPTPTAQGRSPTAPPGVHLLLCAVLFLVNGCFAPSLSQRYPADTGRPIMVTNILNGVTNIAPFDVGGLTP